MRITKDILRKFAADTIKQRKRSEPDLLAAYLMGSLLYDEPLLGGTTDIDLVLVHKYSAPIKHETLALTPEISLDILHKTQEDYALPRQFRQNALIGYPLTFNHILLYDTDHWLEFLQSCVAAEFHRADNVVGRVHNMLASAREHWRSLHLCTPEKPLDWLEHFTQSLELSANAIAGLIGPPLTTRRFMLSLHLRLDELGTPDVWSSFCGLLGCSDDFDFKYKAWIDAFEQDLRHLAEKDTPPPQLALCRHDYYLRGIRALTQSSEPCFLLWPLLHTWLDVQHGLPQPAPGLDAWHELLSMLSLSAESWTAKTRALDVFLDHIEDLIETWADTYGF